jgi:hypothetical protein
VIRRLATGAVLAPFFLVFGFSIFFVPAALASLHGQVSIESGWWQKHAHDKYFDDALPAPPLHMIFVPLAQPSPCCLRSCIEVSE